MKNISTHIAEIEVTYKPQIKPSERIKISCVEDAVHIFREIWAVDIELKECAYMLLLNQGNKVLGYNQLSVGGVIGSIMDVRCVFQIALKANAVSIIIAHNHPSGNLEASDADIKVTNNIKKAGDIMHIRLLDAIIITTEKYASVPETIPVLV